MKLSKTFVRTALATSAVACTLSVTDAAAADLVVNGGFETGDLSGWTSNWGVDSQVDTIAPHSGSYFAYTACAGEGCAALGSESFLQQNLATVAGQTYTLDFFVSSDGGPPSEIAAYWQGAQIFDLKDMPANAPGYAEYTVSNLMATSSSTSLQFAGREDPAFLAVDDISVIGPAAPVPEPGSYALMLLGLGAVGSMVAMRRRIE